MGCATTRKNSKVITIALGSLQRPITLRAVSLSAIPTIIQTVNDPMSQGVHLQLKILQTPLSLITNFPTIHRGTYVHLFYLPSHLNRRVYAVK